MRMAAFLQRAIPEDKLLLAKRAGVDTDETTVSGFIALARDQFLQHFDSFAFSRALEVAWSIVARDRQDDFGSEALGTGEGRQPETDFECGAVSRC